MSAAKLIKFYCKHYEIFLPFFINFSFSNKIITLNIKHVTREKDTSVQLANLSYANNIINYANKYVLINVMKPAFIRAVKITLCK